VGLAPDTRLNCAETHAGVAIDGKFVYFAGGYLGDLLAGKKQPISSSSGRWEPIGDTWKKMANLLLAARRGTGQGRSRAAFFRRMPG